MKLYKVITILRKDVSHVKAKNKTEAKRIVRAHLKSISFKNFIDTRASEEIEIN